MVLQILTLPQGIEVLIINGGSPFDFRYYTKIGDTWESIDVLPGDTRGAEVRSLKV